MSLIKVRYKNEGRASILWNGARVVAGDEVSVSQETADALVKRDPDTWEVVEGASSATPKKKRSAKKEDN